MVHVLIVLGAAVDSISAMVLVRNMISFGGHFILYFSYFFVSHFFASPFWCVSVFMTIVTEPDSFLLFLFCGSPWSRFFFHGNKSVFLKFYSEVSHFLTQCSQFNLDLFHIM